MNDLSKDTLEFSPATQFADSFFAPQHASVPYDFGAASHIGKVRSQNEDHFAVFRQRRTTEVLISNVSAQDLTAPETYTYAMVVADGMGGMKSGEFASRLALQTMVELSSQATSWVMRLTSIDDQQIKQRVQAYVQRIHAAICAQGQTDPAFEGMGTTWTSAHLLGRHVVIVHIGDSRAYLFRDGALFRITRDETVAQSLMDFGVEPEKAMAFRNILVNSFGGGNENVRTNIHHLELESADQLLLCSDGLTDMVTEHDVASELHRHATPQAACDALVSRALENGGRDNVTVVVAKAQDSRSE